MAAAFTVAEAQSALIARVWSTRVSLPEVPSMKLAEKHAIKKWKLWMSKQMISLPYGALPNSEDKEYINKLCALSTAAVAMDGVSSGKPAPFWCPCLDRARKQSRDVRKAYKKMGDNRFLFTSHESLGFDLAMPCLRHQIPAGDRESYKVCFICDNEHVASVYDGDEMEGMEGLEYTA